jgi:phosphoribosylanthranilate isomerase
MNPWIKICANTSLEDARMAVEAGAHAVGFVFAPSSRQVTAAQAAAITAHLPAATEKIGVFVDADLDEIYATVRACKLTGVQLHFEAPAEMPAKLHEHLGPELRILRTVHFNSETAEQVLAQIIGYARDPHVSAVLVDSHTGSAKGGSGVPFNWVEAGKTIFSKGLGVKLIAAGGLNPVNVAQAIATLHPWGLDVASGVEAAPGRKDSSLVRAFVTLARAAKHP